MQALPGRSHGSKTHIVLFSGGSILAKAARKAARKAATKAASSAVGNKSSSKSAVVHQRQTQHHKHSASQALSSSDKAPQARGRSGFSGLRAGKSRVAHRGSDSGAVYLGAIWTEEE
jgi:hypothetical protein